MSIFNKKDKGETIDFTYLQKRGLIPVQKHKYAVRLPTSKEGVVDFSSISNLNNSSNNSALQSNYNNLSSNTDSSNENGAFGFLSNMANVSNSPSSESNVFQNSDSSNNSSPADESIKLARRTRLAEFNSMKVKLEDLEYKFERSLDRIAQLESQLAELKSK